MKTFASFAKFCAKTQVPTPTSKITLFKRWRWWGSMRDIVPRWTSPLSSLQYCPLSWCWPSLQIRWCRFATELHRLKRCDSPCKLKLEALHVFTWVASLNSHVLTRICQPNGIVRANHAIITLSSIAPRLMRVKTSDQLRSRGNVARHQLALVRCLKSDPFFGWPRMFQNQLYHLCW